MRHKLSRPLAALAAFTFGVACVVAVDFYPYLEDKLTDAIIAVWQFEGFETETFVCGFHDRPAE